MELMRQFFDFKGVVHVETENGNYLRFEDCTLKVDFYPLKPGDFCPYIVADLNEGVLSFVAADLRKVPTRKFSIKLDKPSKAGAYVEDFKGTPSSEAGKGSNEINAT